jgi:signal transduction histidine kinase
MAAVCDDLLDQLRFELREVKAANLALERELVQRRLIEGLAFSQTRMLARSLDALAAQSDLDLFLGHALKVTVQQLSGIGGSLWFPDVEQNGVNLHLEYLDGEVFAARESRHPAALQCLPVGGRGVSTFPLQHAETYTLTESILGMPESNREYICSLGFKTLLTVPMLLGRRAIGWICVRSRSADPRALEEKVPLAEALANQATLAVQMARLAAKARHAAILEERNRIARNIHDTLAQGFTGIMLNLEAGMRAFDRAREDDARVHLATAQTLARDCLAEARQSVGALRLEPSPGRSLADWLREQQRRLELAGICTDLRLTGADDIPAEPTSELARIAQESVTNIIRHARATRCSLELAGDAQAILLQIVDDGMGFDPLNPGSEGFGLTGMKERAGRIGATLDIHSDPAAGSTVQVTWGRRP